MKLTKEQFIRFVDEYRQLRDKEGEIAEALGVVEWIGMEWLNRYYELLAEMCELPQDKYIGTELDWFCFDADFGRDPHHNTISVYRNMKGEEEKIKDWVISSSEELWDYLEEEGIIGE